MLVGLHEKGMKTIKLFATALAMLVLPSMATAQSLDYAKSLYEQGEYLRAAKELRPLAEGGDAEAQCMVAGMFFEGKGVNKNEQQGITYATRAAEQGNVDAVTLLATHYDEVGNPQSMYKTLEYYTTQKFPDMMKQQPGAMLIGCLMEGKGVAKDEERAWQMAKKTPLYDQIQRTYRQQYAAYLERHPEEQIFDVVEQMPTFPGGQVALMQFLQNNLSYPETHKQGRVLVRFVIEPDGSISEVQVTNSIDPLLEQEAMRVVSIMPHWNPGKHNGKAVRVKYTIPITFRLQA